jgi:Fic family protein
VRPIRERVLEMKGRLDALRPLDPGSMAALDRWYDVELTYTSNALEGNTLTRSETAIVLEKGFTVSGKPLKDHLEATGHRDALLYMRELAQVDEPLRETDIRSLHRLVLGQLEPAEAGKYSSHERTITGSATVLPAPPEIPGLMQAFVSQINAMPVAPEAAFDAHEGLVSIHPFSDGNGRTARLLMNLLLLRAGYPPVAIAPEERRRYHDRLEAVRTEDDRAGYHAFLFEQLIDSLDRTLRVLHAPGYGGADV